MTDFAGLLRTLAQAEVDFMVVGGFAGTIHGAARLTVDLDVVYSREPDNIERLAKSLEGLSPYPGGAPPGLPFKFDPGTISRGLNFTLSTALGDLDLLGTIAGGGEYSELVDDCDSVEVFGVQHKCLNLSKLIKVKRAAGRPKDFDAIAELELLANEDEH